MSQDFNFLVPKKEKTGVRCGFCPFIIWKHNEARGRLFVKNGRPICARCRIMNGRYGKQIAQEVSKKADLDAILRNNIQQQKANDRAIDIAIASQKATNTQIQK